MLQRAIDIYLLINNICKNSKDNLFIVNFSPFLLRVNNNL